MCGINKNKRHWDSFCWIGSNMVLMWWREIRPKGSWGVPVTNSMEMLKMAL